MAKMGVATIGPRPEMGGGLNDMRAHLAYWPTIRFYARLCLQTNGNMEGGNQRAGGNLGTDAKPFHVLRALRVLCRFRSGLRIVGKRTVRHPRTKYLTWEVWRPPRILSKFQVRPTAKDLTSRNCNGRRILGGETLAELRDAGEDCTSMGALRLLDVDDM